MLESQFVFQGDDRWPSCHASTICQLPGGGFAAAWFAGPKEGSSDSVILGSKKEGEAWSPPQVWVDVAHKAAGNPKLFRGKGDDVRLVAPVNYGEWCGGGSRLFLKRSFDEGESWTDLEILWDEPGILGKNRPLKLEGGRWILPVNDEVAWRPAFLRSEDYGESWELIEVPPGEKRVIQPTLVELSDGSLLAYARSWEGHIYKMYSTDKGESWSTPEPTSLPNNNSGIDMTGLDSGNLVLAFNERGLGQGFREDGRREWGPRNPLVLALSTDEGASWPYRVQLEGAKEEGKSYPQDLTEVSAPSQDEYSYPTVIEDAAGLIHVVYTYERRAIKHVALSEEELLSAPRG